MVRPISIYISYTQTQSHIKLMTAIFIHSAKENPGLFLVSYHSHKATSSLKFYQDQDKIDIEYQFQKIAHGTWFCKTESLIAKKKHFKVLSPVLKRSLIKKSNTETNVPPMCVCARLQSYHLLITHSCPKTILFRYHILELSRLYLHIV